MDLEEVKSNIADLEGFLSEKGWSLSELEEITDRLHENVMNRPMDKMNKPAPIKC